MFFKDAVRTCQVVKSISDAGMHRCLTPAPVILVRNADAATYVCLNCARELAIEILESVPGGRLDRDVLAAKRRVRG